MNVERKQEKNIIAIYTAVFGEYDELKEPPEEIKGCDFYCFTDNKNIVSQKWKIIHTESEFEDKTRDARRIKCLSHKFLPNYKYTLWTDANVIFKEHNIKGLFDKFLRNHDIAIHLHQDRDCVYDEMVACVERKIDHLSKIVNQVIGYLHEGYPQHNGLAETTVVFRRDSEAVRMINEKWWQEIRLKSKRDQLSIDYTLWKNQVPYYGINKSVRSGNCFSVRDHIRNSYVERSEILKVNQLQDLIQEKESLIEDLRYKRSPGIIKPFLKTVQAVKKFSKKVSFHLRNDGFLNSLRRVKNYILYGRGVIDFHK